MEKEFGKVAHCKKPPTTGRHLRFGNGKHVAPGRSSPHQASRQIRQTGGRTETEAQIAAVKSVAGDPETDVAFVQFQNQEVRGSCDSQRRLLGSSVKDRRAKSQLRASQGRWAYPLKDADRAVAALRSGLMLSTTWQPGSGRFSSSNWTGMSDTC